jgi:hypothetical protein
MHRMGVAGIDSQARYIAMCAACYDVTGNDELAAHMGLSARTFDRWKRVLADDGWVIVTQRKGGRGIGVQVFPALDGVLIEFSDIKPINPSKFDGGLGAERGDRITPVKNVKTTANLVGVSERGAKITPVIRVKTPAKNVKTPANLVGVSETGANLAGVSCADSRVEDNNNIYNNINNLDKYNIQSTELEPARATAAPDAPNTQDLGHGVIVNCETITHPKFSISLTGIHMQLLGAVPLEEIKRIAIGHAMQWALDIEAGRANAFPAGVGAPANVIRASIKAQQNRDAGHEARMARTTKPDAPKESEVEKIARLVNAASERQNSNRRLL